MKPDGAGSVMNARARGEVEGDDAQVALWRRLELFPTPPWAARAGGELIAALDPHPLDDLTCWEPAAGTGTMVHGLGDYFEHVTATDVHDHGRWPVLRDFLAPMSPTETTADWIVTNPPFAQAAEFVRLGLQRARRGVAILARLNFLESVGRHELFFGAQPLTVLAPFAERVPMTLGRWDPQASTATAYAWFVWMKAQADGPRPPWPQLRPIPPGTRERLSRPTDLAFAAQAPAPLFDDPHENEGEGDERSALAT